eukprot:TRINITY_DN590_c0_g1_i1.p1 TRINITY_DN590_c0_g1~~TRINITY_DN590_c0_g1_i1.p1  ORF type:complete len:279 (+),score=56.49 TRINITY_DN590_c0_g1_i1:36-839(+)
MDSQYFVDLNAANQFACGICYCVPAPASIVETVLCGHVFCDQCFNSAVSAVRNSSNSRLNRETYWKFLCPICRTELFSVSKKSAAVPVVISHSKFVQRLLADLDTKCVDCPWKGKYADCQKHIDSQHPPNSKAKPSAATKASRGGAAANKLTKKEHELEVKQELESKSAAAEPAPAVEEEDKPLHILYMDTDVSSFGVRVEYDPMATIIELRKSVSKQTDLPLDRFTLMFKGRTLDDSMYLHDYDIRPDNLFAKIMIQTARYNYSQQ